MTRRKTTKRTTKREVETWEVKADTPGLGPGVVVEPWDLPLLVTEWESASSAVRDAVTGTWQPTVIVTVKGRWNKTDQEAELKLIVRATSADEIGAGIVIAGRAANSDAGAQQLREALEEGDQP